MMERTGFDVSSVDEQLQRDEETRREALRKLRLPEDKPILFSPFQSLSIADLSEIFPQPRGRSCGAIYARGDRWHKCRARHS